MSSEEQKIFGFTTQELVRWGIVLLLVVTAIGSILHDGALSGSYQQSPIMVYIPVILVMYFGILAIMYAFGLEPNRFEIIFIPTIIIVMIVLSMSYANIIPPVEDDGVSDDDGVATTTTSEDLSTGFQTTDTGNQTFIDQNTITPGPTTDQFDLLLQNVLTSLSIIFFLAFLAFGLYWIFSRQEFDPDIQIHKVNEYAKSAYETNNTIIEYYIDASEQIERLKGRAPKWYSPTNFSSHVVESPGPPLSSYFDQLTALYEEARFGQKEMTQDDVNEVKDLHHQISYQITTIFANIAEEEENKE